MRHANFFSLTNFSSHFPYENGSFITKTGSGQAPEKLKRKEGVSHTGSGL
jgi:hypothetical protein